MIKKLVKVKTRIWYIKDGKKIDGAHENISGDVSMIRGDVSDIRGDVFNISGGVSEIRGDIDECQITDEERKKGIDIEDLVM